MNEEYVWRILHKPTGLFYCSKKGRWNDTKTNLTGKGNFYVSEKQAMNIFENCCTGVAINKAQCKRYGLDILEGNRYSYSKGLKRDFEVVRYLLTEDKE